MAKEKRVEVRQTSQQKALLEQLAKTPIIQVCCDKIGISRQTYYRWKRENKEFAKNADKAMTEGCQLINDFAESQLINAIKEQNITAVFYWLNHRHPAYSNKLEISANVNTEQKLTPEQEASIRNALTLASFPNKNNQNEEVSNEPNKQ